MAPSLRQTFHCRSYVRFLPQFFYGWLRTVRFQRPLAIPKHERSKRRAYEQRVRDIEGASFVL